MKYTLITLTGFIVFIMPVVSQAGVENVVSMQRDAGGNFNILCDNEGMIKQSAGVSADVIRADGVCTSPVTNGDLEEGLYLTATEFCGQTLKWSGDKLLVILSAPCSGQLQMEKVQDGWYRGGMPQYTYVYEIEVKSKTDYVFYSRSFGTQGDFSKTTGTAIPKGPRVKRSADPTGN